jgi:hypothetical protein
MRCDVYRQQCELASLRAYHQYELYSYLCSHPPQPYDESRPPRPPDQPAAVRVSSPSDVTHPLTEPIDNPHYYHTVLPLISGGGHQPATQVFGSAELHSHLPVNHPPWHQQYPADSAPQPPAPVTCQGQQATAAGQASMNWQGRLYEPPFTTVGQFRSPASNGGA